MAAWVLTAGLALAHGAGCKWLSLRHRDSSPDVSPEQLERIQQISERAQAALDRGDYENARADLTQLVNEEPESPEALQRLGTVMLLEGRLPEAERYFHAALARDRDYVDAMLGLGEIEARRGDAVTALKRFELAISIDPDRPRAHYLLGRAREAVGQADEALASYFRALEFDPNQVRLMRGQAHWKLHHLPEAIADLRDAAQRLPDRPDIYYQLALVLEADHKTADARSAAEQALRLAPADTAVRQLSERLRR